MIWVRKGVVLLLSLILLASLLGTAFFISFNQTPGNPKKVETYLAQSNIYDHFVAYVADQASKSEGGNQSAGTVSLNDTAVRAFAKTSFPSQLMQRGVNAFIDANYAWLDGKTKLPDFKFDLSAQKVDFAKRVGQYVKTYTAGLPVCTTVAAAQQQINKDPLAATCRPKSIAPVEVGAQVTKRLSTTGDFLSDPVITAASVNPKGNLQSRPYYTKLSKLPKAYRIAKKLPYVFGVLAFLSMLGIVFIAVTKRRGLRRVGEVLGIAGVLLIAVKFTADATVKKVEDHVFNSAGIGPLQQSLSDFGRRIESSMVRTDLWFGIAFLVLGLIILGVLLRTRTRKPKKGGAGTDEAAESEERRLPLVMPRKRLQRSSENSIMPLGAKPGGEEPEEPEPPTEPMAGPHEPHIIRPEKPADGGPEDHPVHAHKPKKRRRPRLIQ
ncbi:MAG: hypothetical protein ACREJM_06955 [Candidatus Saccharimonadales bacterium]